MQTINLEIDGILRYSEENILITDGLGNILKASDSCESIYNFPLSYLIGNNVIQLEKERVFNPSVTIKVLQSRRPETVMQTTLSKRYILAKAYPVFEDNNPKKKLIRVISVSKDITDIQKMQEEYDDLQKILTTQARKKLPHKGELKSKEMKDIYKLINQVSNLNTHVFFAGESGVGKLQLAQYLHNNSESKGDFVELDCEKVPENLLDAVMFGYENAEQNMHYPGLIEQAQYGTLLLNNINALPDKIQVKLLHTLDSLSIDNLMSKKHIKLKPFRVISCVHQASALNFAPKNLRNDLFFRLNIIPVYVPPLRERKKDIEDLSLYFVNELNKKNGRHKTLSPMMLSKIQQYDLQGNIRELENIIERIYTLSKSNVIDDNQMVKIPTNIKAEHLDFRQAIKSYEKSLLIKAQQNCKTTYEMAKYLNLPQATLFRKLKSYRMI